MTSPNQMNRVFLCVLLFFALVMTGRTQTVQWDGNGNINASGNWSDAVNWTTDIVPNSDTASATLVNVTSGTRTISIGLAGAETISLNTFAWSQTTATSQNVLDILAGSKLGVTANLGGTSIAFATSTYSTLNLKGGMLSYTNSNTSAGGINLTLGAANFSNNGTLYIDSEAGKIVNVTFSGIVNVDAGVGGTAFISGGSAGVLGTPLNLTFSGLNVNSGILKLYEGSNNSAAIKLTANFKGATSIADGTTIFFATSTYSGNTGQPLSLAINNFGTVTHAGKITFENRNSSGTTTNSGTWKISGTNAAITTTKNSVITAVNTASVAFVNTGTLSGSSVNDVLTFTNNAGGNATLSDLIVTNSGTISPGNGDGAIGTLSLQNVHLISTGTVSFDISGTAAGTYDVLQLSQQAISTEAAFFNGGTLSINLVGYVPVGGDKWDLIVDANAYAPGSSFTNFIVKVNGTPLASTTDYSWQFTTEGSNYVLQVSYVPEPQAWALLILGGAALAFVSCRNRRANVR